MAKWADYLISAVRYDSKHAHIDQVRVHEDTGESVGRGEEYSRQSIINAIDKGTTFVTIFKDSEGKWSKGQKVFVIEINGTRYLKTMENNKKEDNLENLPEF